ncbi:hypothetical protein [Streptosporangium roseum]|uniref:hypothetical protein n=1 Tax=Streptosporangium roseum TaxID=2001 RepID=UPI0033232381
MTTLAGTYKGPSEKGIWIGPHAPDWTHLFDFGLSSTHPAIGSLGKRRVFQIRFSGEVGEGFSPLYLDYGGSRSVMSIHRSLPLSDVKVRGIVGPLSQPPSGQRKYRGNALSAVCPARRLIWDNGETIRRTFW